MNIRTSLTVRFVLIVVIINIISSFSIYYFSSKYRTEDFYLRLFNKASNTAKLLVDVDEIDNELLKKIEQATPFRLYNEKIIIFSGENERMFSTDDDDFINIDNHLLETINQTRNYRFKQGDYEALGFLFKGKNDDITVIVAAIDVYGNRKIVNLRLVLLGVFGVSILLTLLSGWVYSGRALKPISIIIESVKKISIGSLNVRLDEGNKKDEIAKLAATFNEMLLRVESGVKSQKNFIGNASHELRTPLTAMTGQIEVALMKDRNVESYKNILTSLLDDIKKLNNISNRLLVLAQVESSDINSNFTPIRIDELIWQTRHELLKLHADYSILVSISDNIEEESNLIINGNEQLLKIALSNIIENGCKYSKNNTIEVNISFNENKITIQFSDKGIGIPKADIKNIFEPFYRAKNAILFKGSGIGLSLVSNIIKLHSGRITINSEENIGTVVTLSFLK